MTGSRNAHILGAFAAELAVFDQTVFALAARFGGDRYGLIESRLALEGFMASMVMPYAFTPTLTKEQIETLLKRGYAAFSGQPEPSVAIMDVAWLRQSKKIAEARGESPYIEKLVTTKLVSDLLEACEAKNIVYPSLDQAALEALQLATLACMKAAVAWRLKDADITPDFPEIASNTAAAIVFYSIVTRVTQHDFANILRPFEELLREGILVLGQEKTAHSLTAYAFQLYKVSESSGGKRSLTPKHTVMVNLGTAHVPVAHNPDGTLLGIGGPDVIEPRIALMEAIRNLAARRRIEDPDLFNTAFKQWSGFMTRHVKSGMFVLGQVADSAEILAVIKAATGNVAAAVETVGPHNLNLIAVGMKELEEMYDESAPVLLMKDRPTMKRPYGLPMWSDPYRQEDDLVNEGNPDTVSDRAMRNDVRTLLKQHLVPGLDAALASAGIIRGASRKTIVQVVEHSFFNLFDAALHIDHPRLLSTARLVDLHVRGLVPLGFRHVGANFACMLLAEDPMLG